MPRRQTEVLRNLDDSLRILNLLTLRSCGLVVVFYSLCFALELAFGAFTALFGPGGFPAQLALTAALAFALSWVEKHDEEHYVPSALRYLAERPWRRIYGAAALAPRAPRSRIEDVLRAANEAREEEAAATSPRARSVEAVPPRSPRPA